MKTSEFQKRSKSARKNSLREDMKEQGFFDGRFRNKMIINKRKEERKYSSRKLIRINDL
jgi:hypothetical protein